MTEYYGAKSIGLEAKYGNGYKPNGYVEKPNWGLRSRNFGVIITLVGVLSGSITSEPQVRRVDSFNDARIQAANATHQRFERLHENRTFSSFEDLQIEQVISGSPELNLRGR